MAEITGNNVVSVAEQVVLTLSYSGTTLEAQRRYADGIKSCISNFLKGHAIDRDYLIVANGRVVSPSYSYAFSL